MSLVGDVIAEYRKRAREAARRRWAADRAAGLHMDANDRRLDTVARLNLFTAGTEHPGEHCCGRCGGEDDPYEAWDWWGCCCRSPQAARRD